MATAATLPYAATACALVQHGGTVGKLIAAIQAELELEQAAGNSHPLICLDQNDVLKRTAVYIAPPEDKDPPPSAPLGICIRRHFAEYDDFLWIENTSENKDSPQWSAVLVKDGLADEELLNGSKEELGALLSQLAGAPTQILTMHRGLLEKWIGDHVLPRQRLEWLELPVSPLAKAADLAQLEPAQDILRTFRRRRWRIRLAISGVTLLICSAVGLFLFNRQLHDFRVPVPFIEQVIAPADPIPVVSVLGIVGGENPSARVQAMSPAGEQSALRLNIGQRLGQGDEQWEVVAISLDEGIVFRHLRTGEEEVFSTRKRSRKQVIAPAEPIPVVSVLGIVGGENPSARVQTVSPAGEQSVLRLNIGQRLGQGDEQWEVVAISLDEGIVFRHLRTGEEEVFSASKRSRNRD